MIKYYVIQTSFVYVKKKYDNSVTLIISLVSLEVSTACFYSGIHNTKISLLYNQLSTVE